MKRLVLLTALTLLVIGFITSNSFLNAQTLYFCEDVDDNGYPKNSSTSFTIPSSGGWLKFLVRMNEEIDSKEVKYVIYKGTRTGKEKYETTIYQDVEEDWVWFWKKITFYEEGKYNVYVYDDNNNFITSGTVRISYK